MAIKKYNPHFRPIEFWEGLKGLGFIPHVEWFNAYIALDDPRDRIAAVSKLLEYGLPKPKAIEPEEESVDNIKSEASYDLLKTIIAERLKVECQPNGQQQLQDQSLQSSPPLSPMGVLSPK